MTAVHVMLMLVRCLVAGRLPSQCRVVAIYIFILKYIHYIGQQLRFAGVEVS